MIRDYTMRAFAPPPTTLTNALTTLRDHATGAGDPSYRAFERALDAVERGVLHWMRAGMDGAWVIPSAHAARFYVATSMQCSCPHGQPHTTRNGTMVLVRGLCWHRALCEGIALAQQEPMVEPRRAGGDDGRAQREALELFPQ